MSVNSVEVYRCKECNEIVVTAPAGFTFSSDELRLAEQQHLAEHDSIETMAGLVREVQS